MKVFLDDLRVPNMAHSNGRGLGENFSSESVWTIVRDYDSFVSLVDANLDKIELISYDHDLACFNNGREMTGYDCIRYLLDKCNDSKIDFPDWFVHSDNTVGRTNMINLVLNYLNRVELKDVTSFRYYHKGIINNKFY